MMVLLAAVGLISLLALGCSAPIAEDDQSELTPIPPFSTPVQASPLTPVAALDVTEVWGDVFGPLGGSIHFEVAATSKAEVGSGCELRMWSGKKGYDTVYVTLKAEDLEKGSVLTASFDVDGEDQILALAESGRKLSDIVDLEVQCFRPTPTPPPTPTPTPTMTPTPPPSATPTLHPEVVFPSLVERFGIWKSRWIDNYGDPPYSVHGSFSADRPIHLPMCGIVTVWSGRGFGGFMPSATVPLGSETIVLAGDHRLSGSGLNRRDYTLEVLPPALLTVESLTTEYIEQLRSFLQECGG